MAHQYTQADLEAYLDEALPMELMARIEAALRDDRTLAQQLVTINGRRDAGLHSLGEIWRRQGHGGTVTALTPGTGLSIPSGTHFQFRCIGDEPLDIVIVTMPPWPGMDEAVRVADHWPVEAGRAC